LRVARRDDRQGSAARRADRRDPGQLPSPYRSIEDHRNAEGNDRCGLVHPLGHRQVSPEARPVSVATGTGRVLIVVAEAPRSGHVKTRLATSLAPEAIVALYRCLIEDTLELARSLPDTRVAVVCPSADVGELRAWLGTSLEVVAQQGHGLAAALDSTFR